MGRYKRKTNVEPAKWIQARQAAYFGIDATKELPGTGFKRHWPPLIKMDASVKRSLEVA